VALERHHGTEKGKRRRSGGVVNAGGRLRRTGRVLAQIRFVVRVSSGSDAVAVNYRGRIEAREGA
jgi:cytochrome c-type biogenesis protein CcmE